MKNLLLLFAVILFSSNTNTYNGESENFLVPFEFDEAAFTESYLSLFEESKTKFKAIQKGDGRMLEDGSGTAYEVTFTLSQARDVKMLVDQENYHKYIALYPEMASLQQAAQLLNQILEVMIAKAPEGYKYKQAYSDIYENNLKIDFMLETDDHSALGRVPAVSLGIFKHDFAYSVELIIAAPYW